MFCNFFVKNKAFAFKLQNPVTDVLFFAFFSIIIMSLSDNNVVFGVFLRFFLNDKLLYRGFNSFYLIFGVLFVF